MPFVACGTVTENVNIDVELECSDDELIIYLQEQGYSVTRTAGPVAPDVFNQMWEMLFYHNDVEGVGRLLADITGRMVP